MKIPDHEYWGQIYHALKGKPWLKVLETSVYQIPERVRERYGSMFIVYNLWKERYEAHTLDNSGPDTFAFPIPLDQLDCRVLTIARRNDVYRRGAKEIHREMEEHNEKLRKRKEKYRRDDIRQFAKHIRPAVKKIAWRM